MKLLINCIFLTVLTALQQIKSTWHCNSILIPSSSCCNSASWSAVHCWNTSPDSPALPTKRAAVSVTEPGNLSEAHCPALAVALQRVHCTHSSNIHNSPPLGRRQSGHQNAGKRKEDLKQKREGRRKRGCDWEESQT